MKPRKLLLMLILTLLFLMTSCSKQDPVPEIVTLAEPTAASVVVNEGEVSDEDGNIYPTVQIGKQWWMASNLNTTTDPNGNPAPGYCYGDEEENCLIYGRLYNWEQAMNGSSAEGAQGICPDDWHVPTMGEWEVLINELGGSAAAGRALKEAGDEHWMVASTGAGGNSKMDILPSGWFDFTLEYRGLGEGCFLRPSSSPDPYEVYVWEVRSSNSVAQGSIHPDDAVPLRCIKD